MKTETNNAPMIKSRDYTIDLLKAIAIFGVIIIHSCSYNYEIASFNWTSSVFFGSAVRASVPIFFMCSGALLLAPQKNFSLKRFFTKNVLRIIIAMLFWAMAYKIFHLLAESSFSLLNVLRAFKEVLLFNQEFHLYFLQIILLVYLFLPITRIIAQHGTKQQLQYLLALWFVLGIVFPSVKAYWPFTLLSDIAQQYKINMTYAAIGYGLLGYYLKQYPLRKKAWYGVSLAVGFLITFGGSYLSSIIKGTFDMQFLEGMSVGVCLMAAGIFGLCSSAVSLRNRTAIKVILYLSKASFCIFLTHVFFIHAFSALGMTSAILPSIISTPLLAGIILVCSSLVYAILSRIPVVKDWLI